MTGQPARSYRALLVLVPAILLVLAGCASLLEREPLQVTVSGLESLPGEGLEIRMLARLRVQNPNDTAIDYDGISVTLDVQGRTFATGVSNARGTVPRFGEAVLEVPVTVSAMRMMRQVMGVLDGQPVDRIRYEMTGKLSGTGLQSWQFGSRGEIALPPSAGGS